MRRPVLALAGVDVRLVPAALGAWAVAAWGVTAGSGATVVAALGAVALAGVAARRWPRVALVAVAVAAVATSVTWRLGDVRATPTSALAEQRARVTLEVQVSRDARTFEGVGGPGTVVGVVVLRLGDQRGRVHGVRDPVTAFLVGEHRDLVVGRRLTVSGRLSPPDDDRDTATLRVERRSAVQGSAWWWSASERVRAGDRKSVV